MKSFVPTQDYLQSPDNGLGRLRGEITVISAFATPHGQSTPLAYSASLV
jgi:hypothetical protein